MDCPFYLAIATFVVEETGQTANVYTEVNSEETDIDDLDAIIKCFAEDVSETVRITLIANSTYGGPKVVHDWEV